MSRRLFLIDGHALIFKMYYAFLRHPMINSKGLDTSILFGFTKYILEIIDKEKPTHIAISFDPPGKTFRHEMYPEYKGTRGETPQLVIDALEPLCELCHALKIPVVMAKGFEADDVIGTIAKKAEKENYTVYMVTPDKDYGQLISNNIFQYKPGNQGGGNEILGIREVCEKYGIDSPAQVIDMLAICGDTSDNVPGVKGVGEKGAGKLIAKYGSVKKIYENLNELTPKQKEAFEKAEDYIGLSINLITIRTDVPVEIDLNDTEIKSEYDSDISRLFEQYEFGSLRKYIKNNAPSSQNSDNSIEIQEITAEEAVKTAKKAGSCSIIIDYIDETAFSGVKRITVGISCNGKHYASKGTEKDFVELLEDSATAKAGYDLKKQYNVLKNSKITLAGKLYDIELMHYLVNPEKSHRLEILSKSYLDIAVDEQHEVKETASLSLFDNVEEETVPVFKTKEAVVTHLLAKKLKDELDTLSLCDLYFNIEEPLIRVLADMERAGVKINLNALKSYAASLTIELEDIQQRIREMAGEPSLNILSTKQIGTLIFEKLALDPKAKAKTGKRYNYSTDEETLTSLAHKHPIINEILEYRAIRKLLSTYIEPFPNFVSPKTGKIHTTFNQSLTATGRLSSSKPNLQNIPIRTERGKEIRRAFIPSTTDGFILSADYSQIELRIMAHLSGDEHLIEAFREGLDVHTITAAKIFGISKEEVTQEQRRIAKTANFGIIYGISAFGLAQRLKIPRNAAKKLIDDYFASFPSVESYITRTIATTKEKNYAETLFGRRRYLPDINSHNATVRALAERNAINAPIQGTAADIIKKAMINVSEKIKEKGLESRMVLQIHDELMFDAIPSEIEQLKELVVTEMENVIDLSIPLTVECNYGKNWLEAH